MDNFYLKKDIGKYKSLIAFKKMNPDYIRIPQEERVYLKAENIFVQIFFSSKDYIINCSLQKYIIFDFIYIYIMNTVSLIYPHLFFPKKFIF